MFEILGGSPGAASSLVLDLSIHFITRQSGPSIDPDLVGSSRGESETPAV